MKGVKYIVTGCAGFIGSHLVEQLLAEGALVIGLDNFSSGKVENMASFELNSNFSFFKVDISDWSSLAQLAPNFRGVNTVFHLAAKARIQPSIQDPYSTHVNNVNGIFNVLQMMRSVGIPNIVYSASSSAYGLKATLPCTENQEPDCLNPYALTKYVGEQYCKAWGKTYGIKNVCLKYFNVYGERSPIDHSTYAPVIGLFFRQGIRDGLLTIVGDGEQKRDFTYVKDVVRANILAMQNADTCTGETFNVGAGKNYTINEIASMVQQTLLKEADLKVATKKIAPRPAEARETLASCEKMQKAFNWRPQTRLEDVLKQLCQYYVANVSKK